MIGKVEYSTSGIILGLMKWIQKMIGVDNMEIKYKENIIWKVNGALAVINAILNFTLLVFMFKNLTGIFGLMMSPLLIMNIVICSVLTMFYFKITTYDYLRMDDLILSIHRGLVLPRKKIDLTKVEECRVKGNKLILILKDTKKIRINLKNITIKDGEKMTLKLEEYFKIS